MAATTIAVTFPGMRILEQTPGTLRMLIASATPEDLAWQPSPERWSINMVLAHLADVEVKGFASRFHAIAEQDDPFLAGYDQLALFRSGAKFDGLRELDRFEPERHKTLAWLKSLEPSVGRRTGRHEELGALTFDQLLNEFAFHDLGHIRQVIELYRSHAFYPNMGVYQSYYTIHP
jgi:DinB family protein